MADRKCQGCGGTMPSRTHRQRDGQGRMLCEECLPKNAPAWATQTVAALWDTLSTEQRQEMIRREAEAITSVVRVGNQIRLYAHDSGDQAHVNHCPFCGSGALVGGSDGTVECDFCHSYFTVQVQPAHPNMPQTVDGQPHVPPGMPDGEDTELSAPVDPAVAEDEDGVAENPLDGAEKDPNPPSQRAKGGDDNPFPPKDDEDPDADPDAKDDNPFAKKDDKAKADDKSADDEGDDKGKSQPPWLKKKKSSMSYFNAEGDVLNHDQYVAYLALRNADQPMTVLAQVRQENQR